MSAQSAGSTTIAASARDERPSTGRRWGYWLRNGLVYLLLVVIAFIMIFPFLVMLFTSLKIPQDTFSYPPRMLPREQILAPVVGEEEQKPLYNIAVDGAVREMALVKDNIKIGVYAAPDSPDVTFERPVKDVKPVGGFMNQQKVAYNGEETPLWEVEVAGAARQMVQVGQTAFGQFVDPQNPDVSVLANVRLSEPVTQFTWRPQNYLDVLQLNGLGRSLTNTMLVTFGVVLGQLITSVLGGYAFARLRFPGRDTLFVLYLGTMMIPFVVLIMPLYQLMVQIGWSDKLAALIMPWIFTAYGTFLMRQFFTTIPKEIEEAALLDGASRLEILWRIFIPAAVPALATLATFTFLYAWNSFFWPLVIINTGNTDNHVLTLSLNVLRGRAADSPNLVLAGAAISVIPPMLIFILAQRFFIESATSSGVKG
ncbi:MAG: carbohydrate ABC transporter permease [Anaerolineales bacterium]|nr:carbohydrate ABC transporter permease [Anaerolineales bacterium]